MENYKLSQPVIEANLDWFSIIFKRPDLQKESYEQRFYGTTQKTTQKIIELIKANPKITRVELAKETGLSEDGVKFNLTKLKKEGIIKRIGPDKGGHWKVKK